MGSFGGYGHPLNGATPVTVVPAAASDSIKRVVRSMRCHNRDTAAVVVTVTHVMATMSCVVDRVTLAAGQTWTFGEPGEILVLTGTAESVTAVLAGAVAASEPDVTGSWEDTV